MDCPKCGIDSSGNYCSNCGTSLKSSNVATMEPQPAAAQGPPTKPPSKNRYIFMGCGCLLAIVGVLFVLGLIAILSTSVISPLPVKVTTDQSVRPTKSTSTSIVKMSTPTTLGGKKRTPIKQQTVEKNIALGSSYKSIVTIWGQPTNSIEPYDNGVGMVNFKQGYYQTTFMEGKLWILKVVFEQGPEESVDFKKAEQIAKGFLPADIKSVREFDKDISPSIGKAYVYNSNTLATIFTKEAFISSNPGTCVIYYVMHPDGRVFAVLIALGDNP